MEASLKLGNGDWGVKNDSLLAYDDFGGKFRPLPFDFSRASSATVVNKAGLIETVQSGISRIDFKDDANGALLLEPQSTNLINYSEDFSNASWNKLNIGTGTVAVTSNQGVAPNGYLTADRIQFNLNGGVSASDRSIIRFNNSDASNRILTFYLKSFNGIDQQISLHNGAEGVPFTVTGDWQRFDFVIPSGFNFQGLGLLGSRGTDSSDLLVWGVQLEQGSYPTSYIPTQGAISTRLADIATNSGNASLINSEEGTLYFEGSALADDGSLRTITLGDGSSSNAVSFRYDNPNQITLYVNSGGVVQCSFAVNVTTLSYNKIALKYKENDFSAWANGVQLGTDTIGSTFSANTLNRINFNIGYGPDSFYGKAKALAVYKTALTDEQLTALTTI